MRNLLAILLAAMLALPIAAALAPQAPAERWIVAFFDEPHERVGDAYAGGRVVERIEGLRMLVVETSAPALLHAHVAFDDRVRYTEHDDPFGAHLLLVPNDPRYGDAGHWGSKKIGAEAAWDRTLGSAAVKVAMIDSGLNKNHEDIAGARVLAGWDYYNNDPDPDDTSGCSWHGTHTSGTAGASINNGKGIAGLSQHTILPLKAFQPSFFGCGGSTTALVNALKAAGDQGAHISSNSWGSSASSSAYNDAIAYSHAKGTIHVAAAGNSGSCTNCVSYPWKDTGSMVIVVSSSTSSDGFSSFSSQGPQVDVIAPGSSILSTTSGTSGYGTLSGTSMAAPHVTGVAALLKTLQPSWGFADVEGRIKATAVDIGLTADRQGSGRLDADAATNLDGTPPPPPPPPPPAEFTLSATGYKVKGAQQVDLAWSGTTSTSVDVYRDGAHVATTPNDGAYTDALNVKGGGSYTYRVCEAGTSTCSNDASVSF